MANDICVKFGRRLWELREERGWNQKYLAEISGIGRTHISQLENGRREAGLRMLETLADAFKLRLADLLEGV
ncbi:helix-turn-helix transcriptional regulator [Tunturibacter psychrotolerans]|uniref:Helix-turn-helix transcriptional regulator n=1 Tax=Tunturiibacter psychrotolerans TaxID=3069686 RepID=A0AAU7ZW11_9BACT